MNNDRKKMNQKNKKTSSKKSRSSNVHKKNIAKNNINSTNKDNVIKINTDFESKNLIYTKRLRSGLIICLLLLFLLIFRIWYIQFMQGSSLKESAYNQQVINQIISPRRGNIYDSTGKALAISARVDTITINPTKLVKNTEESTKEYKELIAKGLFEIFELDYEEVLKKVSSNSQVETIIRKVEQDKVDLLKQWMSDNQIKVGINIDEDTKRYYPYGNVASGIIGFSGIDNQRFSWN